MVATLVLGTCLALCTPADGAVPAHGRTWELVTPGITNGVRLLGVEGWSDDGNRLGYVTLGPFPGGPSGDLVARGVATRTAQGWTVKGVGMGFTSPRAVIDFPRIVAVNRDMSVWIVSSIFQLLPGGPVDPNIGLYRLNTTGESTLLGLASELGGGHLFYGGDDTLQHVVFDTGIHLIPEDAGRTNGSDAYEFVGTQLRLVGVDSNEQPLSPCGSMIGSGTEDRRRREHPISRDGSRIFFTAPTFDQCPEPKRVYLRTNGTDTVEVSASQCSRADCNAPDSVTFAGATEDGAHAFLVTAQQLTDDDTDAATDLYRYDVGSGDLVRLSAGEPGTAADIAGSALRVSDDGSRVYFLARGALLPGLGVEGSPNLYVNDRGTLRFVGAVNESSLENLDLDLIDATTSDDGSALLFQTRAPLLPSDTDSVMDVYRYDVATGLEHVSLGAGGAGNAEEPATFPQIVFNPTTPEPMRFMSGDGDRSFFVTNEALLPEDTNDQPDAYERVNGTLGLVSSGTGDELVTFAGVSRDGRSAYLVTDETLVPADTDRGDLDVYVARLGGGFPPPEVPGPGCTGDACQAPSAPRGTRPVPDSTTTPGTPPASTVELGLRAPSARLRRQLAKTGSAVLTVDVPEAGKVSLVARARLGARTTVVGRASARGSGIVRLRLKLSRPARKQLARHGSLTLSLAVTHSTLGAAPALRLSLRRPS